MSADNHSVKQSVTIQWLTTSKCQYILPDTQNPKMLRVRRDFNIFYFQLLTSYQDSRMFEICPKLKSESQKTSRTFWQMEIRALKILQQDVCSHYGCYVTFIQVFFHIALINSDFSEFSVSSILASISFYLIIQIPLLKNKNGHLTSICFMAKFCSHYSDMLVGLLIY